MGKNKTEPNFTESLKRLEEIVTKLEDPNLDLELGLQLLEEGVKLHKYCKSKLTEANTKITKILRDNNDTETSFGEKK